MFCPNCGTKNDDSAVKCAQCGFDQKSKGLAPQFKGTVMLQGTANPGAAGKAPGPPRPGVQKSGPGTPPMKRMPSAYKGTMVGVAPPGLEEIRKQAEALNAAKSADKAKAAVNLKGTMVGVAPPGLEEVRAQVAEAQAGKPAQVSAPNKAKTAGIPSSPQASPHDLAKSSSLSQSSPVAQRPVAPAAGKPSLKGTMVGLAPPELQEFRRQIAEGNVEEAQRAGQAGSPATPPKTSAPAASAAPAGPPSKLKGTMIGMAPPNMAAQIAAAKKQAEAVAQAKPAAVEAPAPTDADATPGSEPDPLGGTVVGTSPFSSQVGALDATQAQPVSAMGMPPAASGALNPLSARSGAATVLGDASAFAQAPLTEQSPIAPSLGDLPAAAPPPPVDYSQGPSAPPLSRSSKGPILGILGLVLVIIAGLSFLLMGGDDSDSDVAEAAEAAKAAEADSDKVEPDTASEKADTKKD